MSRFVSNPWSSLWRVGASTMSFLDEFIGNFDVISCLRTSYMRAAGLSRIVWQALWIQCGTIGRTFWRSSKFEDLGKLSLATRFSIYWVFLGLLVCFELP